jgi:chromate transporter
MVDRTAIARRHRHRTDHPRTVIHISNIHRLFARWGPCCAGRHAGIFLPSYIFVAISNPIIPKLRQSPWAGSLLDGVIVASLSLMAAVTFQLGQASLIDLPTVIIFALSAILLFRFKSNSTWLIFGGALAGLLISLLK